MTSRNPRLGDPLNVLLVLAPPFDQVSNGDQRQTVLIGEHPQFIGVRHRALIFLADDLANRPRGLQPGHPGQVHGGLGVAGPAQNPTILGPQGDHVTGAGEIVGHTGRIGQQPHGGSPIGRRNASSNAIPCIDCDGVCRPVLVLVHRVHGQQAQPVADGTVQRNAQVSGGVADHEGHHLRRCLLGGEDQVTLVLPVFVVDDDDGLTRRNVGNRPLDGVQPRHLCYLAVRPGRTRSPRVPFSMNH
ncbi:Uncharacterised protein [Mycobacterium tuberculosis]|uniref:Uncharacterized protein n=1 Tax=Mycobacterium tuberculosis TaxID=1773 RepID=A0A655ANC4_MYCTX|nr:Uncharacterised protein [Mycobacterium tuberculosis]CKR90164.1 Uncharacterised protein [Mycobacterium tuberculosis]CKT25230.1 Uncharacterised protein [Mycobacterium tuberculosis]CKT47239.1 Uncharacterised protein [Mycobacterium tuberculosis]CKT64253.1 Uncharacterised protein [Mycobacterium tuberculosis]